jgi:ABC-type multidrug transport system fused ATPase/permease subunit
MLQSVIAGFIVAAVIMAVGLFVNFKASRREAKGCNRSEVLNDRRVSRWVAMIGVTALFVLPFVIVNMWQPVNPIAFYSTLIAVSVLMVYLTYFVGEKGIPPSLSASFYSGMGYVFTVMCFIVAISTAIGLFELSAGNNYQFFVFLSATGLGFVGAAPMFKDKGMERKVHIAGAALCGVASQAFVVLSGYWYLSVVFATAALLVSWRKGNRMFWFEMAAFASTFAAMELMTFK